MLLSKATLKHQADTWEFDWLLWWMSSWGSSITLDCDDESRAWMCSIIIGASATPAAMIAARPLDHRMPFVPPLTLPLRLTTSSGQQLTCPTRPSASAFRTTSEAAKQEAGPGGGITPGPALQGDIQSIGRSPGKVEGRDSGAPQHDRGEEEPCRGRGTRAGGGQPESTLSLAPEPKTSRA